MKLATSIIPRRDGTVTAAIPNSKTIYVFREEDGQEGTLVADVTDAAHLKWLLGTQQFFPANDDDYQAASAMMAPATCVVANTMSGERIFGRM